MEITRTIARNIILGRKAIQLGVMKDVPVTNVSFEKEPGVPFQDENWADGEPYAVANFNLHNDYKKNEAKRLFGEGEYAEACNQNLSARVSLKVGRELKEAMFATVVGEMRTIELKDEDGIPTGETVETILIKKVVAKEATSFADITDEDFANDDVFALSDEEVEAQEAKRQARETAGMPS